MLGERHKPSGRDVRGGVRQRWSANIHVSGLSIVGRHENQSDGYDPDISGPPSNGDCGGENDVPLLRSYSQIPLVSKMIGRPQGGGLMREFAIYVAAGLLVGFLAVAILCLIGLASLN
jgi:hypothetical protein